MCFTQNNELYRCFITTCQIDELLVKSNQLGQVNHELAEVKRELERVQQIANAANQVMSDRGNELDAVRDWLRDSRAGWSGSDNEFTEYYGELCEMLEVELTEVVEVEIELRQTLKVSKPIGADIDESDFYTRSYVEIYTNSDEVEVVEHIDDASISDVSIN